MNKHRKNDTTKRYGIIACGIFIVLFLGIFKPFEMTEVGIWNLLGYGLITIFTCWFYYIVIPHYFISIKRTIEENIYLKQLPIDCANILTIGTLNFLYSVYVDKTSDLTWLWFWRYQFYTFSIGAILSVILFFVVRNIHLKARLEEVEKINEILEHKIAKANENQALVFESETRNEKVMVQSNDLICIKAEGNYSLFLYAMNGSIQSKLLRLSLKNAEAIIGDNQLFSRSHRSYIVNTEKIKKIKSVGNSYQLWVEGLSEPLPASRQNISDLKSNINLI